MEDITRLIPKDKSDFSTVEELKTVSIQDCIPILANLLNWLQDMNWPVAKEIIQILPRFHKKLIPHIRDVFESDDDIWKYWVIDLIGEFPMETAILLKDDIKRLAYNPNPGEKCEEVDIKAKELLDYIERVGKNGHELEFSKRNEGKDNRIHELMYGATKYKVIRQRRNNIMIEHSGKKKLIFIFSPETASDEEILQFMFKEIQLPNKRLYDGE
ncbi:DUF5071 domain-containing protein [Lacrimispora brassicae]